MNLETFFEKFELFADCPNAVQKMRELILDLALCGGLEGDVSTWRSVGLGEFVQKDARSINPSDYPSQLFELWSVPAYSSGDPEMAMGCDIGSSKRKISDGVVLLGKINPHLNRVWRVCRRSDYQLIASPEWIVLNPGPLWDPILLVYFLISPKINRLICQTAQGMGSLTRASVKQVALIQLPLPPLAEQKRIVAKVDELMALCDALEAQQKESETKRTALAKASLAAFADAPSPQSLELLFHPSYAIDPADLRKSILTLAVQGKLVEQREEACVEMISMESLVGRANLRNGYSARPVPEQTVVTCLPLSAMRGGEIDCSVGKSVSISLDEAKPYLVKNGDVFVIRGNGSKELVGRAGIVDCEPGNVIYPDLFIKVPLPKERVIGRYFLLAWNCPEMRAKIEFVARTTSGILKINQRHISEFVIPLPPLTEQKRIVAKVDELMALVDRLEAQEKSAQEKGARLLEAMVAEFSGRAAA